MSYHGEYHYNSVRAKEDEGNGPALPITLQTPTGQANEGSKAGGVRYLLTLSVFYLNEINPVVLQRLVPLDRNFSVSTIHLEAVC